MQRRWAFLVLLVLALGPWSLGSARLATAGLGVSDVSPMASRGLAAVGPGADFNGDGFDDTAVAVYFESLSASQGQAGASNVIYGSSTGFTATGNQFWTQDSPGIKDVAEANDNFARMPCAADFNGDGYTDSAYGVPREEAPGGAADAGGINVIYGSATGLTPTHNQFFNQASPGIPGDPEQGANMGWPCEGGDFNGDGYGDLAISEQTASVNGQTAAGTVNVIYGGPNGLNASAGPGAQLWDQDSSGIVDQAETGDQFGRSLAAGDFNNDGYQDLAIGVPHEDLEEGPTTIVDAGGLQVIYGGPNGLQADAGPGNQFFTEDSPGMAGTGAHTSDWFARTGLDEGDFNGDGYVDIAAGIWLEDVDGFTDAGAAEVMYGGPAGLSTAGSQWWTQDSPGIRDQSESGDNLGRYLIAGDFNGDGYDDAALGVQLEDLEEGSNVIGHAGAVNVIYGGPNGLAANAGPGNQFWTQDSPGVPGIAERNDQLGRAEGIGDINGDGYEDLIMGVPSDTVNGVGLAGSFDILYGGLNGLQATNGPGAQLWAQDSPGILDQGEQGDYFGRWFAGG